MSSLDVFLLLLVALYVIIGFRSGFIYRIGSLLGNVLGIILAGRFYELFAQKYLQAVPIGQLMAFGIIQLGTSFIVGLFFRIVGKIFNIIAIIPGLKLINKTGGAVISFIEIIFIISVLAFVAQQLSSYSPAIKSVLEHSLLVPYVSKIGSLFKGLLPQALIQTSTLNSTL